MTEYLKPGPEEILGLLPPRLGRWALARVRHDRAWPLKVRTTRLSGFLRLKALAGLRRWRPRTLRFAEEEAWVERWLGLVERTLAVDPAAAREVVATAALVSGYADTYKRGLANWTRDHGRRGRADAGGPAAARAFRRRRAAGAPRREQGPRGRSAGRDHRRHRPHARPRQDRRRVAARQLSRAPQPRRSRQAPSSAMMVRSASTSRALSCIGSPTTSPDEGDRRDAWPRMPRRRHGARQFDVLDALLAQDLLHALDGVARVLQQIADAAQELDVGSADRGAGRRRASWA